MTIIVLGVAFAVCIVGCSFKAGPNKVIHSVGRFKAVVSYTKKCWEGCHTYPEVSFRYGRSTLGNAFFGRELNFPGWRPHASHILFFPAKSMMLTRLANSNDGWLLVAFAERDGEPHLRVLAGCLQVNGKNLSSQGVRAGARCPAQPMTIGFDDGAPYSVSGGFSFHGAYWIDYVRQEVHEVGIDLWASHRFEQVIGITADRNAVLLLFRALDDYNDFALCAASAPAPSTQDACTSFNRRDAPPLGWAEANVSAPFPSEQLNLYNVDDLAATRDWRAWLAGRFDLATLDDNGQPRAIDKKP